MTELDDRHRGYSFEASFVPRFHGSDDETEQIENLCAERTFWSSVQEVLSSASNLGEIEGKMGPAVELRFIGEPIGKRTRVVLNVTTGSGATEAIRAMAHSLPSNYGWKVGELTSKVFESFNLDESSSFAKWQIVRIQRRLNFIDLPSRSLSELETAGTNQTQQQRRQLITPLTNLGLLRVDRYCLPVTGVMECDARSLRGLFEVIRAESPCVISITIAPMDPSRLDDYRQISRFWSAVLDSFGTAIANAGFATPERLRYQYDRFLLPNRFLCAVTMRTAALSAIAARSIALQSSARLGGLRSFKIRNPVITSLDRLGDPWLDVPHQMRWTEKWWDKSRALLREELASEGIEADDGTLDPVFENFLIELPHFYTIDEVAAIAALPVSTEEGLPGLDTRLIAPFTEPSRSGACPERYLPLPENRIRIGLSTGRNDALLKGATDLVDGEREWHTIAQADLTKHAFIVGSTGSGKTITALFLVRELARLRIPFLIIEPVKTEYYQHLENIPEIDIQRVRLEGTSDGQQVHDFLAFDPMRLQDGVSVARHASYLKSCFTAAFPMAPESPEAMILEAGIRSYYTESVDKLGCGLKMFTRGGPGVHKIVERLKIQRETKDSKGNPAPQQRYYRMSPYLVKPEFGEKEIGVDQRFVQPSLKAFREFFSWSFLPTVASPTGGKATAELLENWRQFFERRFEALSTGMIGFAADAADKLFIANEENYDSFGQLLERSTIVELDGIPDDDQKALMMGFLTAFLFERRQAEDLKRREEKANGIENDADRKIADEGKLRHVLFLEEAHRILQSGKQTGNGATGAQSKAVSLFVDMLAEIRAFGQGLVIVEQIPTKIVPEAVKNTNLKIMLRLTAWDDREFLGTAMNFTEQQKRFVTSLRAEEGRGIDMVVFEQQLDQPRLLRLPLPTQREIPIHTSLFQKGENNE